MILLRKLTACNIRGLSERTLPFQGCPHCAMRQNGFSPGETAENKRAISVAAPLKIGHGNL
jgi:hypothetical protein